MCRLLSLFALAAVAAPAVAQDDPAKALKQLEGNYKLVSAIVGGKDMLKPEKERESFAIRGGKLIAIPADTKKEDAIGIKLDPKASPAAIDFTESDRAGGPHMVGIYKLDGNTLTICMVESGKPEDRPKDFDGKGEKVAKLVLEKVIEAKPPEEKK